MPRLAPAIEHLATPHRPSSSPLTLQALSKPLFQPWCMLLALSAAMPALAQQATVARNDAALPELVVSADRVPQGATEKSRAYTVRKSNAATKLDLSLRETPQSVSVVTRAMMDDFQLDNINAVLAGTTGVSVEKVETDRTYYTARGFDITNFQFDGVGVPMTFGYQAGDLDTALVDRIEVVRGANGLLASTGNPSATVNFVRKRPTYDLRAATGFSVGSWNTRRIDADVSGALNQAGTVAARVTAARQQGDSYLDRYRPNKTVFAAVIEAQLNNDTLLTIGHSEQKNDAKGAMWGALPMYFSDGTQTNYGAHTSTSADWSFWNSEERRTFVELDHHLGNDWQWKTTLGYNELSSDSKLFYVYGTPDRQSGDGLFSYPSLYNSQNRQQLLDSYATGKYALAGRQHDLTVGVSWSQSTLHDISHYGQGIGTPLTEQQAFNGRYPEPAFDASTDGSAYTDKRSSVYAATRLNLADKLKLLIGANHTEADNSGIAYGVGHQTKASATTPYAGLVYDLNKNVSAYGSYTEIFNPQYQTDISGATLAPLEGKSYELGLKSEFFARRLNASAALFRVEQRNAAEQAGMNGAKTYYRGIDAHSEGLELELSGELAKGWQGSLGYTVMTVKDKDGNAAKTYVPKKLLRMATTYRLPQLDQLTVGASVNWQGKTSYAQSAAINTVQQGYALLNLMARYDISKQLSVSANLNNVANKKHLSSLYASQAYYGAPINGSVAVNWTY
ncbi:TonB-dependent siderophore receptor [Paraherbaspirillum soli]|uniref:TonB-dependent siderophore receptor n=1 Tax=Paraherbaspirillum soli TaxID=631222 RepID=A0ABW0M5Q8_9BURK